RLPSNIAPASHSSSPMQHLSASCDAHPQPALRAEALLSAEGLYFSRSGRNILTGVSLDIVAGETLTLIGPNGAGKTTLVRLLLGLDVPDKGIIRRRPGLTIGYVPQRFDLDPALPMTVDRFLGLGLGSAGTPSAIASTLAEVGASGVATQQLASLSGGELQRVLLARALMRKPQILVLDEPVQGVDYLGEAELFALFGYLRVERAFAVLMVGLVLHVVMGSSDRVLCLNRHICCSGVPTAVARHPEYERLFGRRLASAFAVYEHHHDHAHDLAGQIAPSPGSATAPSETLVPAARDDEDVATCSSPSSSKPFLLRPASPSLPRHLAAS